MCKSFFIALAKFYFPDICPLCRLHPATHGVCEHCAFELPWQKKHCPVCANPGYVDQICGPCLQDPPAFDRIIAPLLYEGAIQRSLSQLKFHQGIKHARWLSIVLQRHLYYLPIDDKPDLLLPVPLHKTRLKERGYNQALELAKPLAKKFRILLDRHLLCKVRATPPQTEQDFKQRHHNIKHAFALKRDVTGKHVAVIDDVVTTGSTANEIAKLLKKHGARKVSVWAVARTEL